MASVHANVGVFKRISYSASDTTVFRCAHKSAFGEMTFGVTPQTVNPEIGYGVWDGTQMCSKYDPAERL
jgi:hypothetical protein